MYSSHEAVASNKKLSSRYSAEQPNASEIVSKMTTTGKIAY